MPDEITNAELARRLDDIRASLHQYVLKEVATANAVTLESKLAQIKSDLDELESDVKETTKQQAENKRQLMRLFVGALLAAIVPLVVFIASVVQGVPQ